MEDEKFDIVKVKKLFEQSLEGLEGKDDVLLDFYLDAYREINK